MSISLLVSATRLLWDVAAVWLVCMAPMQSPVSMTVCVLCFVAGDAACCHIPCDVVMYTADHICVRLLCLVLTSLALSCVVCCRYMRLAAANSPSADINVMLQLVLLAHHVSSRLNALEAHLRSTLAKSIPRLQALAAAGLPPLGLHQLPSTATGMCGRDMGSQFQAKSHVSHVGSASMLACKHCKNVLAGDLRR